MKAQLLTLLLLHVLSGVKADIGSELRSDLAQSGNYRISLCGSGQPGSRASKLQTLLPYIWQNLQSVLADVELGTASKHGFRSIFKTNTNRPYVRSVFQAVAEGRNMTRKSGRPSDEIVNPTVVCADPMSPSLLSSVLHDRYCADSAAFAADRFIAAGYQPRSNVVVLCPPFWTMPIGLSDDACPDLEGRRRRRLVPNDDTLLRSQFAALLHELVHLYSPYDPTQEEGVEEVYRIQDLVDLGAAASLANAQNFAAYAAAVQAGCERWPLGPKVVVKEDGLKF